MRAWMVLGVVAMAAVVAAGCGPKKTDDLPVVDTGAPAVETTEPLPPPPPEAAMPTAETSGPETGVAQTHTVQKGDTLYGLARRYYGDGKLWTKILEANRDKIKNETSVPVGAVLTIPPK